VLPVSDTSLALLPGGIDEGLSGAAAGVSSGVGEREVDSFIDTGVLRGLPRVRIVNNLKLKIFYHTTRLAPAKLSLNFKLSPHASLRSYNLCRTQVSKPNGMECYVSS
jgi:hypothetical protein